MPKTRPKVTVKRNRSATDRERRQRYQKAFRILGKWMNEPGDYDARVWKALGPLLQDSALRCPEPHETSS